MEHFVTLFDSLFLPQGLALHLSMIRNVKTFTLWIICMDEEVYEALEKIKLSQVSLLKLSEVETEELRLVKRSRTKAEYCWTVTPFAPRFVFEADSQVKRVTYIDADMWFRKAPNCIFEEFENSGKNILITDHSYAPEYDLSSLSGQYCVQFMIFVRDSSEKVRKLWEEKCVDWCFNRYENGKFGDQKYLDEWPTIFNLDVHVLSNKELILAPWNSTRFPFGNSVCYHFHSLRILTNNNVDIGSFKIPYPTINNIYKPYLKDLRKSLDESRRISLKFKSQKKTYYILKRLFSKLFYLHQYMYNKLRFGIIDF